MTERLRIGVVGVGGRGANNLAHVRDEDVVALCDVDARILEKAKEPFQNAQTFEDAREMIETVKLDAVVISTPDHTHAPLTARALRKGLHVYCEKPLTHTVQEARVVRDLARRHARVTQMGTQIHATENYRRVVEAIRAEAIGPVAEVYAFCNSKAWANGRLPEVKQDVPEWLDWEAWLGPAAWHDFHEGTYHRENWRRFWDFGGGTLADMACHLLDLPWWALELEAPKKVASEGPEPHAVGTPDRMHVRFEHAATGGRRAVTVHWYDGGQRPKILDEVGLKEWNFGVLFVGEDGRWLVTDYGKHEFGPAKRFEGFEPPAPSIPKSIGHHAEWLEACKKGGKTTCDFAYSGLLTEAVLLGNVAYRCGAELTWDSAAFEVAGSDAARALLSKEYTRGYEL
ncbi:MAG: Gfo/Idh/MocA family oxidoreductase [Planctomycetes bacterium]|nr:Gfo/Idh/MocA family oxidoreductase [Planctomycetota bacterium]MCB9891126.1 Gfo/Idh/MocA family oxidoreductase [Planctomycetota bacterium]MCB9918893.1 Gfo/Idh/MocA family oxidoreductase [Planctomycetota bacterium]